MYLAYPTPYSDIAMENGDTSDYGDSVSSACITPVSPVFPSVNKSIGQDEEVTQTCHVTTSKSDGNLMCKDCLKNQQQENKISCHNKQFCNLDRDLKSKSCPECRTPFSQNDLPGSTSTLNDVVTSNSVDCDSRSLYLSTKDSCAASVVSCKDSVSEIESSMSSSTATVILDPSEGDDSVDNETRSSSESLSTDNSLKETQENLSSAEEPNSTGEKMSQETCDSEHLTINNSNCKKDVPCEEEGTECIENTLPPSNSSSDSTLTSSSAQEKSPSTTTLRPSSSELFTRYLDVDGLTHVSDPVQDRLRQIEMAHQAKVESLRRQLMDVQRRRAVAGEGGASGRTSDLADEVVCRQKKYFVFTCFHELSHFSPDKGQSSIISK